jgi:hypothetical protein
MPLRRVRSRTPVIKPHVAADIAPRIQKVRISDASIVLNYEGTLAVTRGELDRLANHNDLSVDAMPGLS